MEKKLEKYFDVEGYFNDNKENIIKLFLEYFDFGDEDLIIKSLNEVVVKQMPFCVDRKRNHYFYVYSFLKEYLNNNELGLNKKEIEELCSYYLKAYELETSKMIKLRSKVNMIKNFSKIKLYQNDFKFLSKKDVLNYEQLKNGDLSSLNFGPSLFSLIFVNLIDFLNLNKDLKNKFYSKENNLDYNQALYYLFKDVNGVSEFYEFLKDKINPTTFYMLVNDLMGIDSSVLAVKLKLDSKDYLFFDLQHNSNVNHHLFHELLHIFFSSSDKSLFYEVLVDCMADELYDEALQKNMPLFHYFQSKVDTFYYPSVKHIKRLVSSFKKEIWQDFKNGNEIDMPLLCEKIGKENFLKLKDLIDKDVRCGFETENNDVFMRRMKIDKVINEIYGEIFSDKKRVKNIN